MKKNKFKKYWAHQFANPKGLGGKFATFLMNKMNTALYKAMSKEVLKNGKILDIGFGNGFMLKKFLTKSDADFFGIDISTHALKMATTRNKKAIKNGRLTLALSGAEKIAFDTQFNQIYTINTVYFWNDISNCLKEIYSKLSTGGQFLNICYSKEWLDKLDYTKYGFNKLPADELLAAHTSAGFDAKLIEIKPGKSFCIKAVKPALN